MSDRRETAFIVGALGTVAAVPIVLFAIYYFADSVQMVAATVLAAIVVVAAIGVVFALNKERLQTYFFGRASRTVNDLADPLANAIASMAAGERDKASSEFADFTRGALAQYSWLRFRHWILASSAALLLGFAGLVGSALLKQQNDLILKQNEYFRNQIDQQANALSLQRTVSNQQVRSEAIRRIYGSEFASDPRVKAEALRSLVSVERIRIAEGENTISSSYINLHEADLSGAWLEGADLEKTSWRLSRATNANFSAANLEESVFRFAILHRSSFLSAKLRGAVFSLAHAVNSNLSGADLSNSSFIKSDFEQADLSGANLKEATFADTNLRGADLSNVENWRTANFEGANIADLSGAPDGFVSWALENGATQNGNPVSNLSDLVARQKQIEGDSRGGIVD